MESQAVMVLMAEMVLMVLMDYQVHPDKLVPQA
jgi:hypothetical protein